MGNPLQIYSGPAELSLYDSSNGLLFLDYDKDFSLDGDPQYYSLIDGNVSQYGTLFKIKANLLNSSEALLASLRTRRSVKSALFAVCPESMIVVKNIYSAISLKRDSRVNAHYLEFIAQTNIESDVLLYENLLKSYGGMSSGSGGLATGWLTDCGTKSLATSHLGGGYGNEQRLTATASGQYFKNDTSVISRAPFSCTRRLTASAYVKNYNTEYSLNFDFGIELLNASGSQIQVSTSAISLNPNYNQRISHSVLLTPNSAAAWVRVYFINFTTNRSMGIDNVQLEFGELTDYKEV